MLAGLSRPPRIGVQAKIQRSHSSICGSSISAIQSASSSGRMEMNSAPKLMLRLKVSQARSRLGSFISSTIALRCSMDGRTWNCARSIGTSGLLNRRLIDCRVCGSSAVM
ncbi:hypothetical protein D3C77_629640 [compost metagenome]